LVNVSKEKCDEKNGKNQSISGRNEQNSD